MRSGSLGLQNKIDARATSYGWLPPPVRTIQISWLSVSLRNFETREHQFPAEWCCYNCVGRTILFLFELAATRRVHVVHRTLNKMKTLAVIFVLFLIKATASFPLDTDEIGKPRITLFCVIYCDYSLYLARHVVIQGPEADRFERILGKQLHYNIHPNI